ncbi:MAG: phosphonate ABC transporter ATP-binding protein [Planctomycetota bacterium]
MSAAGRESTFALEDVTVRYATVTPLAAASCEIHKGDLVALVGPSGAGKTTLLRTLNGTVRASEGIVRVRDRVVQELSTRDLRQLRSQIGFIHQHLGLVPNLRVVQNVLAGRLGAQSFLQSLRTLLSVSDQQAEDVHRILDRVGISEKLYERTDRLSGGQQQRVAIARALYQQPMALLADEPVAAVDPTRARDTITLLTDLARERELTLCMSLHKLELAREFFPRLIGLREGRIVFDRPTTEVTDSEFQQLYRLGPSETNA